MRRGGCGFTESDRQTLEVLVRFAAVAIENARLLQHRLQQQRIEQELAIGRQVQQTLLPPRSARLPRALIETVYQPAGQVGGDYFDLIRLTEDEFVVIIGDVSNKGVPAALMMTAVRSVFRLETRSHVNVEDLVVKLNAFLCEEVFTPNSMFVTLVYAYFDLREGKCTYCNAGHLPPFLCRDGELSSWTTGGTALGLFGNTEYRTDSVRLQQHDRIVFYTDGITECRNTEGKLYGRERLAEQVIASVSLSPPEALESIVSDTAEFGANSPQAEMDDITAIMVEIV
jgi:sigma-B regulation protein RsbU (phosphoserine phosphatase)